MVEPSHVVWVRAAIVSRPIGVVADLPYAGAGAWVLHVDGLWQPHTTVERVTIAVVDREHVITRVLGILDGR